MDTAKITLRLWTTAPESYDSFGTMNTGLTARWREREYRQVEVAMRYLDWQKSRYLSGCHDCLHDADFKRLAEPEPTP